jgi:two-component system, OmpR family, phosphate regulon sensor histidine kinase PhoR
MSDEAIPIQHARACNTAGAHASRLKVLEAVQQLVARPLDINGLFRELHGLLVPVIDASGFLLGVYDQVSQTVEIVRQMEHGVELPGGSFPLGGGFVSEVIRTRRPHVVRDWTQGGPRVQVQYATPSPGLPQAAITVPLVLGARVVGVLSVQSYQPNAYGDDDLFLLQAIAAQVAPTIEFLQHGEQERVASRASELEAILAGMSDGLMVVDIEGRIVRLNPPARAMFGPAGAGIILGQPLDREQWGQWPLGAQAVAEALMPLLDAVRRGETRRDVDVELHGEERRVLSFSGSPLIDAAGRLAGGIVLFRDVTTQRDVARLKDELISIASHDLQAPITALKGRAQLLKQRLIADPQARPGLADGLQRIIDQADRLTAMLRLLLDLSRVEAGRLDLRPAHIDLAALAARVVSNVQLLATRHRIQVQAPSAVYGQWDVTRLEQVMQNLLTNAVKYSPDGGTIEVRVGVETAEAIVCVRDEGLGIPAEDLPHVFDRFYRVEGTQRLEGTGLGLYICQGIVSAHGGRIWATSGGAGQGSTFCVALPLKVPPAAEAAERPRPA